MKEKQIIPVVFATNDGYAPYLGVALHSLIENSAKNKEYHVTVMYNHISKEHQKKIKALETAHVKVDLMEIDKDEVKHDLFDVQNHTTAETLYRLMIPQRLPQYDKVLYLDCDMVILSDVADLFSMDLQRNLLGVGELLPTSGWFMTEHIPHNLKVTPQDAFNAGVLLMDTKLFQEEQIKEKSMELLEEDWSKDERVFLLTDQDVLTVLCQGRITRFPMTWNYEWQFGLQEYRENLVVSPESQQHFLEQGSQVKILHYSSVLKPWAFPEYPLADIFWKYAKETVFYEEIIVKETRPKPVVKKEIHFSFPWEKVKVGSTIVIYGAGLVGQDYMKQLSQASYCFVAAVCDKNASKIKDRPYRVVAPETLLTMEFDLVLIAIEKEEIISVVKKELMALGVPEEKIK